LTSELPAQVVRQDFWAPNGTVSALLADRGILYVGGTFDHVGPRTGPGVPLDISTASPMTGFPRVEGSYPFTPFVYAAVSDGKGGWFIGGTFITVGGQGRQKLAHIASDMSVTSWNPGCNGTVYSLALDGSTLYVGGVFTSLGGQARNRVGAVDALTGSTTTWDPNVTCVSTTPEVDALAVGGTSVYLGGLFCSVGGLNRPGIAAVSKATGLPTGWNPGGSGSGSGPRFRAIAVAGPVVYVGGDFYSTGGMTRYGIAALDAATGLATSWNPGAGFGSTPNGSFRAIVPSGATVYVGGRFSSIGGQSRSNLAALDAATGLATAWNPVIAPSLFSGTVDCLVVSGSTVYAGGGFTTVGGVTRTYLAGVDIATGLPTSWDPRAGGEVAALSISGSGIYAGGLFTSMGGESRSNIAAIDIASGRATDWNPGASNPGTTATVNAIAAGPTTVYFAGNFNHAGNEPRPGGLAAADASTGQILPWDPAPVPRVSVMTLAASGAIVYAGGSFSTIGGQPRYYVAALDGVTGEATPWDPSANDQVLALAVDGSLVYAGGNFTAIGGQARSRIAALDSGSGLATGWNPTANAPVIDVSVKGSTVYATGSFASIGGQTRHGLAALDAGTGLATPFNPNLDIPYANSMISNGSAVYAGGDFHSVGGQPRESLAQLDPTTGAATSWRADPSDHFAYQIAVSGATLFAGGTFINVGGQDYLAAIVDTSSYALDVPNLSPGPDIVLHALAPNPARSRTNLRYELSRAGRVTLEIVDVHGRRSRTLLRDAMLLAGAHEIDLPTRGLAPGLYFVVLTELDRHATQRLVVLN
jgi:hypothetical protein